MSEGVLWGGIVRLILEGWVGGCFGGGIVWWKMGWMGALKGMRDNGVEGSKCRSVHVKEGVSLFYSAALVPRSNLEE